MDEREAILSNPVAAARPQPVDYGLTYDDLNLYEPFDDQLKYKEYKQNKWIDIEFWKLFSAIWFLVYSLVFAVLAPNIRGMTWSQAVLLFFLGFVALGVTVALPIFSALLETAIARIAAHKRRHPSPGLIAYSQARHRYDKEKAAAEAAAREAARDAELRKRSYWAFLDGYEFERATAEVLKRHQFNPRVTPGSADGGIDIEVTRNGLKGVVQCKAHVVCVGPHVVRDLYGVIHHCGADFGIIVSRGGFTRGAVDFARDKPILFLDASDLIAMQEGRDVLAAAFSGSSSVTRS